MINLSEVKTRKELAEYIGTKEKTLTYVLYGADTNKLYTTFTIPKKSGGNREISAPADILKIIQRKFAESLWAEHAKMLEENNIRTNIAHGFIPGKSIITNAKIHRNKKYVLNLDLEHFFDSFTFSRVRGYFEKNWNFKVPHDIAVMIAQLTCYNGRLPQGAPTSPVITNLICQILDYRILELAKQYKLDYTRYADDLTFSTNDKRFLELCPDFLMGLDKLVKKAGFSINWDKYRLQYKDSRQSVTGLVVNEKINVPREFYKTTKSMAHALYKEGKYAILDPAGKSVPGTLNQLEGRFAFIDVIVHYNNSLDGRKHKISELSSFERQYRYFLFYKYFYANDRPIIVTEGKTDIQYIQAALKSLYQEYPALIRKKDKSEIPSDEDRRCKNKNDEYEFNVQFLHRTNRLMHFFGLNVDGADGIGSLCETFFSKDKESKFDCYQYIFQQRNTIPKNPVILLFDNENAKKSKKPLHKFLASDNNFRSTDDTNELNLRPKIEVENEINTKCFSKFLSQRNAYVATIPLPDGMKEAEIEDLFDEKTLKIEINGKKFDKDSKADQSKCYSKDVFSKYINRHYEEVNFDGFRGLLDVIMNIINDYSKVVDEELISNLVSEMESEN